MTEADQTSTTGSDNNQTQDQPQQEQFVSKKDAERLATELSKYKSMAEDLQNKFKNQELESAKAANDWQKVAEVRQQELDGIVQKFEGFKKAVVQDKRLTAIREEAIKAGLRRESLSDLGYLDYPEVKLQTDDEGNFKVDGADKAIQRLKTTRPHWFAANVPNVNLQTPNVTGGGGKLSLDEVKKLQAEYTKNPTKENRAKTEQAILELRKQSSTR